MHNDTFKFILDKVNAQLALPNFPHITKEGKWITTKKGHWTGGFWAGILWLCYMATNKEEYQIAAHKVTNKLEKRQNDKTFDLGFLFYYSHVLGYQQTNDKHLKNVALNAADNLLKMYNEKNKVISNNIRLSGKNRGRTIIDVMMNLCLLWWAFKETDDNNYYTIAYEHSINTINELIRDDYSTIQIMDFDLETGEIIHKKTAQGYSNTSCWSRGQAWGMYGFIIAYKSTKEKKFLKTAERLSEYFICNLPQDHVPYWDFNDPSKSIKDSSAAAIACSAIFDLYEINKNVKFKKEGCNIINSLITDYFNEQPTDGLIKHGCYYKPKNIATDESLIFGDYYFLEALLKCNPMNP